MTWLDFLARLRARFKSRIAAYWRDYDVSCTDIFFGVDYLMVVGGLHLNSRSPKHRRWWNLYRVMIVLTLPLLGWKLALNVSAGKKLDVILQSVQIVLGTAVALVRAVFMVRNYDRIMAVRRYGNRRNFGRNLESTLGMRAAGFYNIRWAMTSFSLFQLCAICPLSMMDLTRNDTFGLPFDLREFSGVLHTLVEKFYCFMLTGLTCNGVVNNATVYMILKGLLTEMTVVAECFEGVMERAVRRAQAELESTAGPSKTRCHARWRYFWNYLNDEFRECVRLHQQFLDTLKVAKPLLNVTLLIAYYSTTLNIAFGTVYLLSTEPSQMGVYSCQVFYYVGMLMTECWILAHLVTKMTGLNESIGGHVYALNWPEQLEYNPDFALRYRATLDTMTTVMVRARHPLRLNCFGFFEFTLERFAELVNLAYSLVTFFRNFV
ncbi:hypothetical protein quinque_000463 [Culex quinquefasciatus]|uniref:uncharacterized protein LOC119770083 n=1 Tax=Culex quinquefasciatus TaxID=7176 RepID=UPI0018E339A5|nr:uncharacterized protein LOC119770083 [Culex quinquefasciatus]